MAARDRWVSLIRLKEGSEMAKVRIQTQYKLHPTKTVITGYLVYAWIGHPLLGKVRGTERVFQSETSAKKYATGLRKLIKD